MDGYFGHLTEKITGNNPIFLQLAKRVAIELFHFVIPTVTSNSNRIQGACLRGVMD